MTRYDSMSKLSCYDGPLFVAHGDDDALVPFSEGERLFAAAPSEAKQFCRIAGHGHNGVISRELYIAIEDFLVRLPAPTVAKSYDKL
jgi:fermentation-respiration switch protein FrsA (DUF1100 family)